MPGAVTLNQPGTFSPSLSFPFEEKLTGCGRDALVWRIFKILVSPLSSPPSSGPRQPRGMLGTQAWALGQVGWGGGEPPPFPFLPTLA